MVIMVKQDKQEIRFSVQPNPNPNPNPSQTLGLTLTSLQMVNKCLN